MVEDGSPLPLEDWNSAVGQLFGSDSRRLVFQRFQCPSEVSLAAIAL